MPGLQLETISHAYGRHAVLHDVSVHVAPGELVCLLGPSGCGKTTLLRLAAGLEQLQSGRIAIDNATVADGTDGRQLPPERRGIGLMFQDYALFPHLNVRENVAFGLGAGALARRAWIDEALGKMGLADYADAYPHVLSGGQQQRVALLRALAPDPKVLLLDEPFSGLDVTRRAQIRSDTLAVVKASGVATLMVTHDPEEAMFMADRILVMNDGRVVQDGSPTALYFAPADVFVTELFGPVNRFAATVRDGMAATPLGDIAAADFGEGTAVEVLIRQEALRPSASDVASPDATTLEVVTARPLGRDSHILLRLADGATVEARVPGIFLPAAGARLTVAIDPERTHVFRA